MQAGLLVTNALLILNRKRFLSKYGLDQFGPNPTGNTIVDEATGVSKLSMKGQLIGLLNAVQYLKFPVIAVNVFTIIFEIILGGAQIHK